MRDEKCKTPTSYLVLEDIKKTGKSRQESDKRRIGDFYHPLNCIKWKVWYKKNKL
jgi:hypothetical protein